MDTPVSETEHAAALPFPGADGGDHRPVLPRPADPAPSPAAIRSLVHALAAFHRGDRRDHGPGEPLAPPGEDHLPALLHAFRDPSRVRTDYPLFLAPSGAAEGDALCTPVSDLLQQRIDDVMRQDDDGRILKDNLARLERRIRDALDGAAAPVSATDLLREAGEAMVAELALHAASSETLRADLRRLIGALPVGGRIVALGDDVPLHLFVAAARHRGGSRRAALRREIRRAQTALRDLLRLDRTKAPEAAAPDALSDAVGPAGAAHLDTEMLAHILGSTRGTTSMDPVLRGIVEESLSTLDRAGDGPHPLVTVVCATETEPAVGDDEIAWRRVARDDICRAATDVFDAVADEYAKLFAALRVARSLAAGEIEAEHLAWLRAAFDRTSFSREELLALPPVVALASSAHLAGRGMLECSRLLRSGRPVEVIVTVPPAADPAEDEGPTAYRFELAYLGISHREVLVHQSSAARPAHLVAGFQRSLDAATGSLHVITSGLTADGEVPRVGTWFHAGAALSSRAHPFIHYDPEAGATWARRFDLSGNPQPENDWPEYELACRDEDGTERSFSLAFTFADFALLEPRARDHFRVIPPSVPDEQLVPLAEALAGAPETSESRLPFIRSVDAAGRAHRLVVDRTMVSACRDRLDYWRTLQELAGIRNEHVKEAVARERERLESAHAADRSTLIAEHAEELARVRRDEARAALERLARTLLGADAASLAASVLAPERPAAPAAAVAAPAAAVAAPAPDAPAAPAVEAPPAAAAADDADEETAEEPWIDSALCTTCNDCLDINGRLFVYNANKQAIIGDPRAGTYAQLVQAAEKCPARCIHPGLPLDPTEPGLDALIERARPFNG